MCDVNLLYVHYTENCIYYTLVLESEEMKDNPFNPNSTVTPALFAGRALQVDKICKKLGQLKKGMSSSFFIYGERGIGKTALAKIIKYIASNNAPHLYPLKLITSYYIVDPDQSISSVLQESINKLTDQIESSLLNEIGGKLGKLFKDGKFEIGAFGITGKYEGKDVEAEEKKQELTIKDQAVSILSNLVKAISSTEPEKRFDGILIIIDEVHNIKDLPRLASIIRNIVTSLDIDGIGKVSFILIGYKEDVDKFFSEDTSSRRIFDTEELGTMPNNEAEEILTKGFNDAKIEYDLNAIKSNIKVSGGYPHSVQLLGHNLIEKDKDNLINDEDWIDVIFETAVELQKKDFSHMYNFSKKLTDKDRILQFLAEQNKSVPKNEIYKMNFSKNTFRCLQELKRAGAIRESEDEEITLHSQLFVTAIRLDMAIRRIMADRKSPQTTS